MSEKNIVETSEAEIAVHWQEEKYYHPNAGFVGQANLTDASIFERMSLKNFPDYLSKKLEHDYTWLNKLFFEVQNTTIENFLLKHKIERVKELLVYNKLKLADIASQLNFRDTAQLSVQFKEITGFSPNHFTRVRNLRAVTKKNM